VVPSGADTTIPALRFLDHASANLEPAFPSRAEKLPSVLGHPGRHRFLSVQLGPRDLERRAAVSARADEALDHRVDAGAVDRERARKRDLLFGLRRVDPSERTGDRMEILLMDRTAQHDERSREVSCFVQPFAETLEKKEQLETPVIRTSVERPREATDSRDLVEVRDAVEIEIERFDEIGDPRVHVAAMLAEVALRLLVEIIVAEHDDHEVRKQVIYEQVDRSSGRQVVPILIVVAIIVLALLAFIFTRINW